MTAKESTLERLREQKKSTLDAQLQEQKSDWINSLEKLVHTIRDWTQGAEEEGILSVEPFQTQITEQRLGSYTAPALHLQTPGGQVVDVLPRAMVVAGAYGRVELIYRTGGKAILIRTEQDQDTWAFANLLPGGQWTFIPLNEENFWETFDDLLG